MSFRRLIARTWSENRLFSVLLELTYRCNLDCMFCYNDLSLRGKAMRFDDYDRLLQDLAEMQVLNLSLSGGEPLAHPEFFRIGAKARELGFVIRVKSNGHALDAATAQRMKQEVDPLLVEVSLHGATAATHERQTRIEGSFGILLANIRSMLEAGLRVKINSTLTLWNESESEAMFALADSLGLPLRFDLQVSPRDDGSREPLAIAPSREGIRALLDVEDRRSASAPAEVRRPTLDEEMPHAPEKYCGAGSAGIAVDPYGNVYPCVQWRRPLGNLHERRLREIWSAPGAIDRVRSETATARQVVDKHPDGQLLNFCPGLAELLTGSPTKVPPEMEWRAAIIRPEPIRN
jgi:MoaA/NifB/PqqE/SkfB family radical SAM enzyme